LGRLDDEWFGFLEASVRDEWGMTPLRIREGGVSLALQVCPTDVELRGQSIPSVPYLEKEFGCHALHLPLGQSSVSEMLPFYAPACSKLFFHAGSSTSPK
jgi:di- and tripeptidase